MTDRQTDTDHTDRHRKHRDTTTYRQTESRKGREANKESYIQRDRQTDNTYRQPHIQKERQTNRHRDTDI